ncbi:sodium-independent anion transporter [Acrocarpospora sp. B8E8]|uniref:sodium-independent anion transporter n=1 Tax=Acrocarpospora sp. B8E8 TaxID=3153572 RepID=UPI00325E8E92
MALIWANSPLAAPMQPFCLASSNDRVCQFDYAGDPDDVIIDLSDAHIWDASSVAALDAVETKYAARGKKVAIVGLNQPSARLHDALAGQLAAGH